MISKKLAIEVLNVSLSTGADYAEIFYEDSHTNNISLENGKVETSASNSLNGVGLRLLKENQCISGYTNDLTRKGYYQCRLRHREVFLVPAGDHLLCELLGQTFSFHERNPFLIGSFLILMPHMLRGDEDAAVLQHPEAVGDRLLLLIKIFVVMMAEHRRHDIQCPLAEVQFMRCLCNIEASLLPVHELLCGRNVIG